MKRMLWLTLVISSLANAAAPPDTEAVEFYNTTIKHYFVTANAGEALTIDSGAAGAGWIRTGRSFQVWGSKSTAPANAQPVCRFHSSGANSHFYTADATECAWLKQLEASDRSANAASGAPVTGWIYEGIAFFTQVPSAGACPAGTAEVLRTYNNGFATGAGSNHRFVDDPALGQLMVDKKWTAETVAFCVPTKSTGTSANLPPTTTSFAAVAGTWKGTAEWKTDIADIEKIASLPLDLTIAADGAVSGSGNGCAFTGKLAAGDGFRSFYTGAISANGCTDTAFNGDYARLKVERFGATTMMVRMKHGDAIAEASIEATLSNDAAVTPPVAGPGYESVAGDWVGTVAWKAQQGSAEIGANKPLALTVSSTGGVTGSGFGCAITGQLGESLTLAGCDKALFNGKFTHVRMKREGSRLEVDIRLESPNLQVEIEGRLNPKAATDTPPPPAADPLVTGAWEGKVGWLAVERAVKDSNGTVLAAAAETIKFTIAGDGAFTGAGFGCAFAGKLTLGFEGRAVTSGTVTATGCTKGVFNGEYKNVYFEHEDGSALEIGLARETVTATSRTKVVIAGRVARPAPVSAATAAEAAAQTELARVASLIVAYENEYRRSQGRQDVARDAKLTEAARQFAEFMAKTGKFDHQADGRLPWDRALQNGYHYCLISENIAYRYSSQGFSEAELARQFFEGWKGSPGHNRNMLEPAVVDTGIAIARSPSGRFYAVQMFGRPSSKC
jgi:uncharacterized protein YkwD